MMAILVISILAILLAHCQITMRLAMLLKFFDESSVSETSGFHVHGVENRSGTNARQTI